MSIARRWKLGVALGGMLVVLLAGCADDGAGTTSDGEDAGEAGGAEAGDELTIYSGRSEELVGPILDELEEDLDVDIAVRYGDTAEMAAQILEEGDNSPADLFFGQDAGALGALEAEGRLVELPEHVREPVDDRFVDPDGRWVGTSGRARVIGYNTDAIDEADLPDSLLDFTEPEWADRVGWSPPNGSFQAHVTALRVELGDDATLDWLEGMEANGAREYENNTAIVEALGRGEIDAGLVNHYYLYRFLEEDPDFPVDNAFLAAGDIGNLVNIAGVGVIDTSDNQEAAFTVAEELVAPQSQQYFADEVFEYPVVPDVEGDPRLPSIEEIDTPDIDLSDLDDLEGTIELLRQAGLL